MGSNWSSLDHEPSPDPWWPAQHLQPDSTDCDEGKEEVAESTGRRKRGRVKQDELEKFKQELACKRAMRKEALGALQTEMKELRSKVEEERKLKQQVEQERDKLKESMGGEFLRELIKEREEKKKLIEAKEKLLEEVQEKAGLERQVQALKDVSEIGKEMLRIRELQVKELKKKLVEINISSVMAPPEDLRVEYEKQIENIRKLRTLYEERAAATLIEHQREMEREEARINVLETKLSDLQKETSKVKEEKIELEGTIENLERTIQQKDNELETTRDELFSSTVQNKSLNSQMTLINNLFSHMILSPKVDLGRLIRLLKENHDLITDLIAKGDSNEVAALLVDLAGQVEKEQQEENKVEQGSEQESDNFESQSEISSNLTKVWTVMVELLSHYQDSNHTELSGGAENCYKSIETPTGPRSVISVSQTFLTLKDLILEKNRLVKEVGRLKTLNNHLEHRLGSQEKRLVVVTTELRKTWGIVNKLKAQHKQLHTHEKILRYELQQKRCMLTELKQELEHCRDKWEQARQKNTQTEEDWKKLRKEFAARKSRKGSNSAESGYEDEDLAQSPPSEPINYQDNLFELKPNEGSEPELSEEDIEHSDGNSFDTVIDLLDIACLENQTEGESGIPFVLCEVLPETEISPSLLPLSGSEFTEGLDQIESEDLAAVLDIQYQNQLLGVDYNLYLPSSSRSSPVQTDNDDFASSEVDVSEEDSSINENHIYSSPLPIVNKTVPEDALLFGSNSSKNISEFLDGLFVEQQDDINPNNTSQNLSLDVASTSQTLSMNDTPTPLVNNENCYQFPDNSVTPIQNGDCCEHMTDSQLETVQEPNENAKSIETEHVQECVTSSHSSSLDNIKKQEEICEDRLTDQCTVSSSTSGIQTEEEALKNREDRLKRLEQHCRSLVSRVTSPDFRNEIISRNAKPLCCNSSHEGSDNEDNSTSKEREGEKEIFKSDVKGTLLKSAVPRENPNTQDLVTVCPSQSEPSHQCSLPVQGRTPEEVLQARASQLKRLEDQCKMLFSKMSATYSRSELISNKLDELHDFYGPSEQLTVTEQPSTSKVCLLEDKLLTPEQAVNPNNRLQINEVKPLPVNKEESKNTKSPDLISESKEILNKCFSFPSPSVEPITTNDAKKDRTPEEILEARAECFKRLEEQCKSLVSKMTATSLRSEIISNKLDELHSCYGSSEDTSDNDEQPLSSREGGRRRSTPTASPRYSKKLHGLIEKDKEAEVIETKSKDNDGEENTTVRGKLGSLEQETEGQSNGGNSDRLKRSPEEILQARAERLNRLEEQCKSLFSKMGATSQRSDVISNRLEELHEQYGQPSRSQHIQNTELPTSEQTESLTLSVEVTRLEGDENEETSHLQNTNIAQQAKDINSGIEKTKN